MADQPLYEKIIGERLRTDRVPPPPAVWKGVEAALQRQRRRRLLLWWSGVATGVVLLLGIWLFSNQPETHFPQSYQSTVPNPVQVGPQTTNPSASIAETTAFAVESAAPLTVSPIKSPNQNHENTTATPLSNLVPTSVSPTSSGSEAGANLPQTGMSNLGQTTKEPLKEPTLISTDATKQPLLAENSNIDIVPVIEQQNSTSETTLYATEKKVSALQPLSNLPGKTIVALKSPAIYPPLHRLPFTPKRPRKATQNTRCYDFERNSRALFAEIYAGPLTVSDRFATPALAEWTDYLNQRAATEGQGWGFTAGGRMGAIFNRNYWVGTGLQYQQHTQVFRFRDIASIRYIIDLDPVTGVLDTVDIIFGEASTTTFNRFGQLHIPIELGYEWRRGNGGIRLQGGAAVNIWFWKRGAILHPTTSQPAYFTPNDSDSEHDVFKVRTGWSLQGSAQVFYYLQPRTRLFVEPYSSYTLNSITNSNHPLAQRPIYFGLRLGVAQLF
jgi:Outer membrane protein beta-barrel domain